MAAPAAVTRVTPIATRRSPSAPAAELLYVPVPSVNAVYTYDISLASGTAVQNSQQAFATQNLNGPAGIAFDAGGTCGSLAVFRRWRGRKAAGRTAESTPSGGQPKRPTTACGPSSGRTILHGW